MGVGKGLAPAEKRKRRGVRILPAEEGDRNPGVPLSSPTEINVAGSSASSSRLATESTPPPPPPTLRAPTSRPGLVSNFAEGGGRVWPARAKN